MRTEERRERRLRLLTPFLPRAEHAEPAAPSGLLRQELHREVAAAVAKLPLRYRVPLVLHEIEGWSYVDIAQEMGCREGTVKSRVHRGRQQLKRKLEPYWKGGSDMEDHRLGDLLRELPREHARPGFTARVLSRLDAPEDRRFHGRPRLALAGAMAAVAAVAISAGVLRDRPAGSERPIETTEAQRILRELRAEHGRLEREFHEISEPPVLYLGGDEEVDLVLDLRNVQDAEGVVPAAYHHQTF